MKKLFFVLLFFLSTFLILFLIKKINSYKQEEISQSITLLHNIKETDLNFNQSVLKAKFSIIKNYDLFSSITQEMEKNINHLKPNIHPFLQEREQFELIEKISEITTIKKSLIENFKTVDSLLKVAYKDLSENLKKTQPSKEKVFLNNVMSEIFSNENKISYEALLKQIKEFKQNKTNNKSNILLTSFEIALLNLRQQEEIIESIISLPSTAIVDKLIFNSSVHLEEIKNKILIMKLMIGFLIFIIITISFTLLIQLKTKEYSLEKLNSILLKLNSSFEKFIPKEFFLFFGEKEITDIKIGTYVEAELTVLYSNFSHIFEQKKTSLSNRIHLANNIHKQILPIVKQNGGFIEKFSSESLTIYFKEKEEEAVETAKEIFPILNQLQEEEEYKDKIGIGLHRGSFLLGFIGEGNRIGTSFVSDSIQFTNRIEKLAKIYHSSILISENIFKSISKEKNSEIRFLDRLKEKDQAIKIYEIYSTDSLELRKLKNQSKPYFESALEKFYNLDFKQAKKEFLKCLKIYPNDIASEIYLEKCKALIENPQNVRLVGSSIF